jgi:predicted TIM-barrel fold metal-dependent hydrolase
VTGRIDVHQHLWPRPLIALLLRRLRPPFLREEGDGWTLSITGEPRWPVIPADHDPALRAALVRADGLDAAVVALSSPLGIEALPAHEARPLIDAYHEGLRDLPRGLRAWASAGLASPDPRDLARRLDEGFVGLCLPAGGLLGPEEADRCSTLLAVLEERGAPLFVHPGPAPRTAPRLIAPGLPAWWPAMTAYVAQMQAAWLGFQEWVRPAHPELRVCFAMLAGLAPLHAERLASRGREVPLADPLAFYDTSSYGPRAIAAMRAVVGEEALVYGSDRPVVPPPPGHDDIDPSRVANPARLFALQEVHA